MLSPELLTHPNIPKPLHGITPRDILGKAWWDQQRQIAYRERHYHCWACGVHKSQAAYYQWLEGHESYDIDYVHGIVTLREIVALCHACHSFIHIKPLPKVVVRKKGYTVEWREGVARW